MRLAAGVAIAIACCAIAAAAGLPPNADAQSRGRRASRRPRLSAAQQRQIRRWHAKASAGAIRSWSRHDPPPLVLLGGHPYARVELWPAGEGGGFDAADMTLASQALAARDGSRHEIHPRLIELVYRAVRRFRAPYVHVISGYRTGSATSRHAQGRAIDFVLPGTSDRALAGWARQQGFVGVGIYPRSGFVHLDVRARSYFWTDSSGPGQRNRERPILSRQRARMDAAARRRGETPVPDVGPDDSGSGDGAESEIAPPSEIAPSPE